ncbi:MAG: hypothetical protein QXR19_15490 [Candidatus Jordarchaeaceae archaeon]
MSEIFVSHGAKDVKIRRFFSDIFSITNVRGVFKEIEGFRTPQAWIEIQNDIQLSRAIFVLLGPHVQEIKHTRDWVVWESAIGSPMRKEIWVFEPYEHLGKIDVIIPHVDHYMIFQQTKEYQDYIKQIIEAYDTSQVLPATLIGGITGGLLLGPLGALSGAIAGGIIADPLRNKPPGLPFKCEKCFVEYRIHSRSEHIRCPTCNTWYRIDWGKIEK